MRVAVVGAGIAGLTAARELASRHEVHLFEASGVAGVFAKPAFRAESVKGRL